MRYKQTLTIESDRSDRLQKVAERMARKAEEEGVEVMVGIQEGVAPAIPDSPEARTFDSGAMGL